ncbi:translation initiation factor eIF4e [Hygrophoropsis aurantiaca]|uniref:Translation initiation factor eIF4e n=1 Tax=Hygrophoropsis aurantiaca TaxID=72124 RepID=A0ACB8A8H3_9AGAM|nr:translation initiation factor eIF4e [Hygrophoropsis aurantiaca]
MSTDPNPNTNPPLQAPKPRAPSLNQLAARINASPSNLNTPSSSRPRLAASILRTGSTSSLATNDSTLVQAPSSVHSSISPAPTPTPSIPEENNTADSLNSTTDTTDADPLTADKLVELNRETSSSSTSRVQGYKNIPTLDAITARLASAKARSLSIDGTPRPPDPQPQYMIDDPSTPGGRIAVPPQEHPLQFTWTIYHDSKTRPIAVATPTTATETPHTAPESDDYEAGLSIIGTFNTVESFCRYFNWLKPPSKLERNSNYHIFKAGIKPMWEDEANAKGGKWVLTMRNNAAKAGGSLLDRCWSWLAMALVGEELEEGGDEICGAVVSLRSKVDRIQVWTRSKDDVEKLNGIGRKLVKLLDVSEADGIGLEFQYNTDDRPLPNKFLSIQALPTTSFRSTFGSGGAFGGGSASAFGPGPGSGAFGGPGSAFGAGSAFGGPGSALAFGGASASAQGSAAGGMGMGPGSAPPIRGTQSFGGVGARRG